MDTDNTDARDSSRQYWFPVATADQVGDTPFATELLGERIVLARIHGQPVALHDLCIHRGTPLSRGRVTDDAVECAYHGWCFDAQGRCVRIPQLPAHQPIPSKARVASYRVQEKYGAWWVCLGDPVLPIPELPEFSDPDFRLLFPGAYVWEAGAARMMENFLDTAHFAWVHSGLLGDARRPELHITPLESFPDGFEFTVATDVPHPQGEGWVREPVTMRYYVPYGLKLTRDRNTEGKQARYVLYIAIQPISRRQSRRYTWAARNHGFERSDESVLEFLDVLREQDRGIVESQRPEELPLDLSEEMHISGMDGAAVEFRRTLARRGLTDSARVSDPPPPANPAPIR